MTLKFNDRVICWMCPKCAHVKKYTVSLNPKDSTLCGCGQAKYRWHPEPRPDGCIFVWDEHEVKP